MNINYLWNFGMLVSTMIVIQILTGILLATYYCPDINVAYNSVMFMIREVNNGVFIQTIHSTGASMVFALTAIHIVRGANLAPYTPLTWLTGILMLCLLIVISFMGYVLPWGQMSYWGATVITNLLSPIPYLVNWICGGYNISNPTIKRFFVIHFVLPFICCGLIVLHLFYLHSLGSNNPLQLSTANKIPFHPYIVSLDMKGLNGLLLVLIIMSWLSFVGLSHPDNAITVNRYVTPLHIVPEWYFLSLYAILKAIPSKIAGLVMVVMIFISIYSLSEARNRSTLMYIGYPMGLHQHTQITLIFLMGYILMWIGAQLAQSTFISYARITILSMLIYLNKWSSNTTRHC